jgi:hypothetical protein
MLRAGSLLSAHLMQALERASWCEVQKTRMVLGLVRACPLLAVK